MKTKSLSITSDGQGVVEALAMTTEQGAAQGLQPKEILRLRLLTEELCGLLRGLVGGVRSEYWLEYAGKFFRLHLKAEISMTNEIRSQLLSVSSSGKNAAAQGFMGRVREFIAGFILTPEAPSSADLSLAMMNSAATQCPWTGTDKSPVVWSLEKYKNEVMVRRKDSEEADSAWYVLEKSIVANIADEITISILGSNVEMIIDKDFG